MDEVYGVVPVLPEIQQLKKDLEEIEDSGGVRMTRKLSCKDMKEPLK